MLAEQIANQMAKAGGIGIADQLARSTAFRHGLGGTALNDHSHLAAPLAATMERGFLRTMASDAADQG
jgi:Rod binding domain-containing protein